MPKEKWVIEERNNFEVVKKKLLLRLENTTYKFQILRENVQK